MGRGTDPAARVISAIVPDGARPGSVRLFTDGKPYLTVAADVVSLESLGEGVAIPDGGDLAGRLSLAADAEAALRTALQCLGRRAWATRELSRRLVQRGHPPAGVERALEKLTALGLLDDLAFARQFCESRAARGFGPARVRKDLAVRGVAPPLADRALDETIPVTDDPARRPRALLQQRVARVRGLPRAVALRRLVAYLARRGYVGSEYRRMVRETLASTD